MAAFTGPPGWTSRPATRADSAVVPFLEQRQPVGIYPREQGALVPTKLVHTARSCLSKPDVDRTANSPWDCRPRALACGRLRAPHFRDVWDTLQKLAVSSIVVRHKGRTCGRHPFVIVVGAARPDQERIARDQYSNAALRTNAP